MGLVREAERFVVDSALLCHFVVEIDGLIDTGFKQVQGLEESLSHRSISENNVPVEIQVPDGIVLPDVTLRKGLVFSDQLYEWYAECRDWLPGQPDYRKSISVVQLKFVQGIPVEVDRWNLYGAWVKAYRAPAFHSQQDKISVTEVVIGRSQTLDKPNLSIGNTVSGAVRTVKSILQI